MRFSSLILICSLSATTLTAQFGVTVFYQSTQVSGDYFTSPNASVLGENYEFAADYWFRFPGKRIEVMPTVSYSTYENAVFDNTSSSVFEFSVFNDVRVHEFGVQLKTNFYLFDLNDSKQYSTSNKRSNFLEKGFFIQLAPGVSHYSVNLTRESSNTFSRWRNKTFFNLSAGAGFDFAISNLLTITPLVSYRYNVNQAGFSDLFASCPSCLSSKVEARFSTLQAGIRIGVNLNKRQN